MFKKWFIIVWMLLITACTPPPAPKPQVQQIQYPYVAWKRSVLGRMFIVEDAQRRLFGVELDDNNRPIAIHAFEKHSGREKWSREAKLGLTNPDLPWSVQVYVRGTTLAYWEASNRIVGLDRYSGAEKWEKPVDGRGLGVMGENFVTVFNDEIRLIDSETGKVTSFSIGRKITDFRITPRGYVLIVMGETASLVDLENEKLTVRWEWNMDLAGGFRAGFPMASDDAILFFQKTAHENAFVHVVSYDLQKMTEMQRITLRGNEEHPRAFSVFSDRPDMIRMLIKPLHSGDIEWYTLNVSSGEKAGIDYISGKLPSPCYFGVPMSWCGTESGITAYTTHPWKEAWSQETIYPGTEGLHKIVGDVLITAGGSRIKAFTQNGSSPYTYDLKSPTLSEPRVNRILGVHEDVVWFTVVDYSTSKTRKFPVGEVWAYKPGRDVLWRIPVGNAQNTMDAVVFLPTEGIIVAADETSFLQIALSNGAVTRRPHKVRITGKESLQVKVFPNTVAITCSHGVHVFELTKARDLGFVELRREVNESKVAPGKTATPPFAYSFLAADDTRVYVRDKAAPRDVIAIEIKSSKVVWKLSMTDLLDPTVEPIPAGLVVVTAEKTRLVHPVSGQVTAEFPGSSHIVRLADRIVLFHSEVTKPTPAARLVAVSYDPAEGSSAPVLLWQKAFEPSTEPPLAGFPVVGPLWVKAETDFVMFDSKGGRCLTILASADASVQMELCKSVWPWPPVANEKNFLHASGAYISSVPDSEQGLLKFSLNGRFRQLMKLGKPIETAVMWPQFTSAQKQTIHVWMSPGVFTAIQVANPDAP